MAVPKKRTSKTKKNLRKSVWKKEINAQAMKSLSLGKSLVQKTFKKAKNELKNDNESE